MYKSVLDHDVCVACLDQQGLCPHHARHVCPQLKEPSWYRDAHSGMYYEVGKHLRKDRATELLLARKQRKAAKRAQRTHELAIGIGIAA